MNARPTFKVTIKVWVISVSPPHSNMNITNLASSDLGTTPGLLHAQNTIEIIEVHGIQTHRVFKGEKRKPTSQP